MPRGLRVCAEPGCPNLRPCATHAKAGQRRADAARPSSAARGYDRRWRRKSEQYRRDHPTCEVPACSRPSTDVDHRDGLGPLGPHGFDDSNLMAMCHPHHASKTATLDGGFGNRPKAVWRG